MNVTLNVIIEGLSANIVGFKSEVSITRSTTNKATASTINT